MDTAVRAHDRRVLVLSAVIALILVAASPVRAELSEHTVRVAGRTVHYKLVLPDGYVPAREYPGVLVFGGGPQTMNVVDNVLSRNFRVEAEQRGYIVIAPAAPDGELFFEGGARIFPEFLETILSAYKIQGGTFHIAGPSNGGIAAMHVAAAQPSFFRSVTAFPGYLWQPSEARLRAVANLCVFLYVGEFDEYRWHQEMENEVAFLRTLGTRARYTVEKGQPHRIETLAGPNARRLFDGFEEAARGCRN